VAFELIGLLSNSGSAADQTINFSEWNADIPFVRAYLIRMCRILQRVSFAVRPITCSPRRATRAIQEANSSASRDIMTNSLAMGSSPNGNVILADAHEND
jgi:hypothetical protein